MLLTRGDRLVGIAIGSVAGGILFLFGIAWSFGLIVLNAKAQPASDADWVRALTLIVLGLVTLSFVLKAVTDPFVVTLGDDGLITFRSVVGSSRTNVSEIQLIEMFNETLVEDDSRRLRITYGDRSVTLSNVAELEQFVEEITRRNPRVRVRGWWKPRAS